MPIKTMPVYEAYRGAINLRLYSAFVNLVEQTTQEETAEALYRQIKERRIWQIELNASTYFETYQLRYPGEVLERFEEKIGNNIQNIRALALALSDTCLIQSDNMFVGSQKNDFLQKVRRIAEKDIYLRGALYQLETDAVRQRAQLVDLTKTEYQRTEEALFVLSLYDDAEEGYQAMRSQLVRLFGNDHDFRLDANYGVMDWFIGRYSKYVKSYKGKTDLVLRTLMKVPHLFVKQESREFAILTEAGYRSEEIALFNSLVVWANRIPDRLSPDGIPAEKIAAECCRRLLNCNGTLPQAHYDYIGWLLRRYDSYEIKYEGIKNLWSAIQHDLHPTAPNTILWMKKNIKAAFPYRFDVFDPWYDVLATELENECYMELFAEQLLYSRTAIPIQKWLARYRALTGADFYTYFQKWHRHGERTFALLVEHKEINLWQYFEEHRADGREANSMHLIQSYALSISSWRCYRFVKKLVSQYSFSQIHEMFEKRFRFYEKFQQDHRYNHREYKIHVVFPFLGLEEQREVLEWIDASVFQTNPEGYQEFVKCALESPEVQRLYSKEALAGVLKKLLDNDAIDKSSARYLKSKFYTKEELEAEQKAEAAEESLKQRMEEEQAQEDRTKRLKQTYDGTLVSLKQFSKNYYYTAEKKKALYMVYEKMCESSLTDPMAVSEEELKTFFNLCETMLEYRVIPTDKMLCLVRTMIGGIAA